MDSPLAGRAREAPLFERLSKAKLPGAYLLTRDDGQTRQHPDQDKLIWAGRVFR